jgi:Xaa-Pro dipeptidase
MAALDRIDFDQLSQTLREMEVDGWLIYDFHGSNPVAQRLVGYQGMLTRRLFLWLPASGEPLCIAHTIDKNAVSGVPGRIVHYTTWQELHELIEKTFAGKRVAMETSPDNAVPYLDRVPVGVAALLSRFGTTIVPSDVLVTRFAACWSPAELELHRQAAEEIAQIARNTLQQVVTKVDRVTEYEVQQDVIGQMTKAGLEVIDPPIVGFGPNAANPHYDPTPESARTLGADEVVLLDLFGLAGGVAWADQTWMAFSGGAPPPEVVAVWEATRDARDAAVATLRDTWRAGEPVTGATLDDAARAALSERGFAAAFTHRTGHSIDADLHGSGPHLDNFETNDIRRLLPGVVFSVEPGVYLTGKFGVRSEVNVILLEDGPEVTPHEPQVDLILP